MGTRISITNTSITHEEDPLIEGCVVIESDDVLHKVDTLWKKIVLAGVFIVVIGALTLGLSQIHFSELSSLTNLTVSQKALLEIYGFLRAVGVITIVGGVCLSGYGLYKKFKK